MKILHINNPANVAWNIAKAQKKLGHDAKVAASIYKKYKFPLDIPLGTRGDFISFNKELLRISKVMSKFDILHIHEGIKITHLVYYFLKIRLPKLIFVIHLHGTDARSGKGLHYLNLPSAILYTTPDLARYVSGTWIPQAVELPRPLSLHFNSSEKIRIGHFPTNRIFKGTFHVIEGFKKLVSPEKIMFEKKEGINRYFTKDFELIIVEGMSHIKALEIMANCDVIVDQINDYGTNIPDKTNYKPGEI